MDTHRWRPCRWSHARKCAPLCVAVELQAETKQTNPRQVLGFDFFKQIWIPCCRKSKHTTNERRPPQIRCGVGVLVTLKRRQRLSNAVLGWDWIGLDRGGGWGKGLSDTRKLWIRFCVFTAGPLLSLGLCSKTSLQASCRGDPRSHNKGADHHIPVRCIPKAGLVENAHIMSFKH